MSLAKPISANPAAVASTPAISARGAPSLRSARRGTGYPSTTAMMELTA